ncbi:Outer membrane protein TolC [Syntrophus gentianae]|uniref:Outer membrane protein TolC n=1 Tax=Syntrophus gentianae TaxID=43775 RepID=A0A1H7WW94_9BACT|nr:TolC family protein [Syntrophus gentianae]SEM25846.1 Outer membrane protein TolC [Syntrophus gentianae]
MKKYQPFLLTILLLALFPALAKSEVPIQKGERLNLSRCVETALRNHPVVQGARDTIRIGESRIGQAQANYYPQVNWQTDYTRINRSRTGNSTYSDYNSSVVLSQTLYDFGKTKTSVNIEKLTTDSFRQDLHRAETEIVYGVKSAYFSLLQAEKNRDVAVETVAQFQHHLTQAKGFFEVGTKPKFDVTKAEVDLSNAVLNRIRAENDLRIARVGLVNALGIPSAPEFSLDDSPLFQKEKIDLADALERAYRNRPDLQSIGKKVEAADESIKLARKGYYPYVTGSAGYGYSGEDFPLRDGWNVGALLNVPLFSGFQTRYAVEEAKASLDVLRANEASLRQTIRLEVEQALSNLREAQERTEATRVAVRQAEENAELANGRYDAGVGNPIEVTDALVSLSNARTAYIAALTDCRIAQAGLEKSIGKRD